MHACTYVRLYLCDRLCKRASFTVAPPPLAAAAGVGTDGVCPCEGNEGYDNG